MNVPAVYTLTRAVTASGHIRHFNDSMLSQCIHITY